MREHCKCKRCPWEWTSRIKGGPKYCPGCKSPAWRTASQGSGNWVPVAEKKINTECSKCKCDLIGDNPVYLLTEGTIVDGIFQPKNDSYGVYCEKCVPDEDALPFAE